MIKVITVKRCPEKKPAFWRIREIMVAFLINLFRLIATILACVSGILILGYYYRLMLEGHILDELQKLQLDYSLSIFTGSVIYLFVYGYKVEDLIKQICGVLDVPKVRANEQSS